MYQKVLYKGLPYTQHVGTNAFFVEREIHPSIVLRDNKIAIYIQIYELSSTIEIKTKLWLAPEYPNVFALWRMTLLLYGPSFYSPYDIERAYRASLRGSLTEDQKISIHRFLMKAERVSYQLLMLQDIPDEIVMLVIQLHSDGYRVDLNSIVEEARVGTLEWREYFTHIGLKKP